jgi:hypothetical protein
MVAVFVVALLGGGIDALVTSVPDMAYAARWEGTPGRMTVTACAEEGFGRTRHTRCAGIFRSDDGRIVDADAGMSQSLSPGSKVPVQRKPSGGYTRVGFAAFCGWLSVALFGVLMLGAAVMTTLAVTTHAPFKRGWHTLGALLATALLTALTSAIGGSLP